MTSIAQITLSRLLVLEVTEVLVDQVKEVVAVVAVHMHKYQINHLHLEVQ